MQCENCQKILNKPIMESFFCCLCSKHYCFYCTDTYIQYKSVKHLSALMKYSERKKTDIYSIKFGYKKYRNIKNYVEKFYCEHCFK